MFTEMPRRVARRLPMQQPRRAPTAPAKAKAMTATTARIPSSAQRRTGHCRLGASSALVSRSMTRSRSKSCTRTIRLALRWKRRCRSSSSPLRAPMHTCASSERFRRRRRRLSSWQRSRGPVTTAEAFPLRRNRSSRTLLSHTTPPTGTTAAPSRTPTTSSRARASTWSSAFTTRTATACRFRTPLRCCKRPAPPPQRPQPTSTRWTATQTPWTSRTPVCSLVRVSRTRPATSCRENLCPPRTVTASTKFVAV
mmetsp:Transcript_31063/g.95976  ORF Transcript_31063/g.95976 Transcript_31063/m.95976 type:complete len:253 (+) Transcript_31063:94-852(+)